MAYGYRRLPAEWEPQSGVQITWPHENTDWKSDFSNAVACFKQIVKSISKNQKVLLVCADVKKAKKELGRFSSKKNIVFQEVPTNDTWARDHAPLSVFDPDGVYLLNFTFNGWGRKYAHDLDDKISRTLKDKGAFANVGFETHAFILEGGSIESDGNGCVMTTSKCLLSQSRNPAYDKELIEHRLKVTFGVANILWLDHGYLEGDDTDGHIDTLARFCDNNTIAYVKCSNMADSHFLELQSMEKQLATFKNAEGKAYKLVPLPMPDAMMHEGRRLPATYANFLITNHSVLVPTYNCPQDNEALAVIKSCFPNREIIGIDCRALVRQGGSLHCVTMQYPEGALA